MSLHSRFCANPLRVKPLILALAVLLAGFTTRNLPVRSGTVTAAASQATASLRLAQLFREADEAKLRQNPLYAITRGDQRYAYQQTRYGEYLTDAYIEAERAIVESQLATIRTIDRNALTAEEQIAYEAFRWEAEQSSKQLRPEFVALTLVRPIDQLDGAHMQMASFSSGEGGAPFRTVADYDNNLKRLDDFIRYLDRVIVRMREGLRTGVVQPRVLMEKVVGQLDDLSDPNVEASPYFKPLTKFPEGIAAHERERLKRDYALFIRDKLNPAHRRLRDFIKNEYIAVARPTIGLSSLPGGDKLYQTLIEWYTTLPVTAAEVHQMGLAEVARIGAEMEKVKRQVGFKGSLAEFAAFMRDDPRFKPKSVEEVRQRYLDIQRRVNARLGKLFLTLPKAALEVRPVEAYRARTAVNAFYATPAPDASRPGIFYFNGYDLQSRVTFDAETLFLHEGIPGHHLQRALALENSKLPQFLRDSGPVAFGEGWALYAETLGPELGLFKDPYQVYGHLVSEMFRAARLVVDTGIHAKGWTRDQAIQFMLNTTAYSKAMLTGEVDRYIARPAHALAYKIGGLTMQRLRARAERDLGTAFDIREFHEQVLMTGRIPLPVLKTKVDRWIASKKSRGN